MQARWKNEAAKAMRRIVQSLASMLVGLALVHGSTVYAAPEQISGRLAENNGLWRDVAERDVPAKGTRLVVPNRYRLVTLDLAALAELTYKVPMEGSEAARQSPTQISLPLPDGGFGQFQIVETPVMAPGLAAKFPEIKTWSGQGIDDPAATVRLDWTPQGFHGMVLSPTTGRIFIDPYSRDDTDHYISYFSRDHVANKSDFVAYPPDDPGGLRSAEIQRLIAESPQRTSGTQLRTYRLAVAATAEYTAFSGGTVPLAQAAIVTAVNRVTGIYESEVAVRLQLVSNNNLLIYTNASTDPYSNNDGLTMLAQNQATVDAIIGSSNYDIGHVFSTGGGGIASLGVPCVAGQKARGVTGSSSPTGDGFWVDYVAHEMGHQFGANHTFNSTTGSCGGGNRNASTAYEPGSGSTIMAYAGICGADDLQPHSDPYFHSASFDEIVAYSTAGSGNNCPVTTATGNSVPVPSAGTGGFTIPARTPFTLTGSATDANSDSLTYNWEEYDLGTAGAPGNATNPPFFRSWNATASPSRTFPRLTDLLNNTTVIGEVLPNATRALNFRMTVRDNRANGGGVAYSALNFNVTTAAGPFQVTSPNTTVTWAGGSSQTVTWNVANTAAAPVSCANVGILLSTDGGQTFPTTLAASAPNNGSATVSIPNSATSTARIKVYCTSNVFFDISNVNFTIGASGGCSYALSASSASVAAGASAGSVNLTTTAGCSWTAVSNASWITVTSGASGSGSGTVGYSVAVNTGAARSGTLTIGGQTYTVSQAAASTGGTNLVQNAGFESGAGIWAESSTGGFAIVGNDPEFTAHTGSQYAYLGGYDSGTDTLYQDVTIPASAQQATLNFWYKIVTNETTTTTAYDTMAVELYNPVGGAKLATLATFSNLNATGGWVQSTNYDVTAYKGQTVRLKFTAHMDSADTTAFLVDDVSLIATSAAPTPSKKGIIPTLLLLLLN